MFQTHIPGEWSATGLPSEEFAGLGSGWCDINLFCTYDVLVFKRQPANRGVFQDALCIAIFMDSNGILDLRGQKRRG